MMSDPERNMPDFRHGSVTPDMSVPDTSDTCQIADVRSIVKLEKSSCD